MLPCSMGDSDLNTIIPTNIQEKISEIKIYFVENIRTARRFLKQVDKSIVIDDIDFYELDKNTDQRIIESYVKIIRNNDTAIMSEAGCPGIADPGSKLVNLAHQYDDVQVVPCVGPSSILLSLIASGLNGQNFVFHGYLPVKNNERIKAIKDLNTNSRRLSQTQIFIETPYRNSKLIDDLIKYSDDNAKLCLAANITTDDEFIKTRSIKKWKNNKPELNKIPCVFLLLNK
jgi:16S rRNA (cytidine1402-2'-O)-methyltransferase